MSACSDVFKDIGASSLASIGTVYVGVMPFMYVKNGVQEMKISGVPFKIPRNPTELWKGAPGFCASFAPTIALQTAAYSFFSSRFDPLLASVMAGASSAVLVTPSEIVMNRQQKEGGRYVDIARSIYNNYGVRGIFRGILPTAVREGGFTLGYKALSPAIRENMKEKGYSPIVSQGVAGIASGFVATLITQTSDGHSTQLKRDFNATTPFYKAIFNPQYMAGFGWRFAMVSVATTCIPFFESKIKQLVA